MESVQAIQDLAEALNSPGGVMLGIVGLGILLWKRKLVLGWLYDECTTERDQCRGDTRSRLEAAEAQLDKMRGK